MYERIAARDYRSQRGDIMVVFLVTLVPTLAAVGLAVDLGLAYRSRAGLVNAVDAGALAAVRSVAGTDMEQIALRVAAANFAGSGDASYTFEKSDAGDEGVRVEVRGTYDSPAYFSRLIGNDSFTLEAVGAALRVPVDLSLLLDTGDSLNRTGVLNTVKTETKDFVQNFNETVDRVGVLGFSTIATQELALQDSFLSAARSAISGLRTLSDTNFDEGLRATKAQLDAAGTRPGVKRYVVMITDGRPTAFRDTVPVPFTPPGSFDGVVAATVDGSGYRGLFALDGRRVKFWTLLGHLNTAANDSTVASPLPLSLPGGLVVNGSKVIEVARGQALAQAGAIRAAGVTIIAIAINPPNPTHPLDVPDVDLLKTMANVSGVASGAQPQGLLFVTDPDKLGQTLDEVAGRILSSHLAPASA
jgi:hypothetical protein